MISRQDDFRTIEASGLIDAAWYAERYEDVRLLELNPVEHFMHIGAKLLRDPGPRFDTAYYLASNPDVLRAGINPLLHYLAHGRDEGRPCLRSAPHALAEEQPIPVTPPSQPDIHHVPGAKLRLPNRKTVLVCAHQTGQYAFGGERSLLDVLDGFSDIGCNVIVTTPGECHGEYFSELIKRSTEIFFFSYEWWERGKAINETTTARFARLIADHAVDAVHANTLMLREPLIAARRLGIPAVVHVRELVTHDDALCDFIGQSPAAIIEQVLTNSDWILANSEATARCFAKKDATHLVQNTFDDEILSLAAPRPSAATRIALISSNLPKKGLSDFADIALILQHVLPTARFLLIGPENEHVGRLRQDQLSGKAPCNIEFVSYKCRPADAIAEADIVLNLSHFQESFGRTVLEAMAGGRATVAYAWGALPELVVDGETGFLVPFNDVTAVAEKLQWLCQEPTRIVTMGAAGRVRAEALYGKSSFAGRLQRAYREIWL